MQSHWIEFLLINNNKIFIALFNTNMIMIFCAFIAFLFFFKCKLLAWSQIVDKKNWFKIWQINCTFHKRYTSDTEQVLNVFINFFKIIFYTTIFHRKPQRIHASSSAQIWMKLNEMLHQIYIFIYIYTLYIFGELIIYIFF